MAYRLVRACAPTAPGTGANPQTPARRKTTLQDDLIQLQPKRFWFEPASGTDARHAGLVWSFNAKFPRAKGTHSPCGQRKSRRVLLVRSGQPQRLANKSGDVAHLRLTSR